CLVDFLEDFQANPGRPLGRFELPSETMFFGTEGTGRQGFLAGRDLPTNDGYFNEQVDRFASWHAGRTGIGWLDGHAKSVPLASVRPEVFSGVSEPCRDEP
ncbi:MAG: hypothetical protein MH204_10065, partial [Fimbriimonadaceae bacterium]|nr:hypothetical protein [Fimbriimonadaceae bacterium]